MMFRAVILDVDGTLVDSNEAHVQTFYQAITEAGYTITPEKIRKLVGMGSDNLLPAAIGVEKDSAVRKQIAERRKALFKERYLENLKAFPEVRDLVERLHHDGYRLVIASSGEPEEIEQLLKTAGVTEFIEEMTSAGDVDSSKPAPDSIQAALDKLGEAPEAVVMLGDTPYDIQAAGKAGVRVIALRCGGFSDEELAGALAIYDDPADLLRHYDAWFAGDSS